MTNNNDDLSSCQKNLTQCRRIEDSGQQKSEFHNSKSMFEGHFKFDNVFLHINTNNKQLFINTLIETVKYLSRFR